MTLGILSGGWRIVRTLGFAIYSVRPVHALEFATHLGGVIFAASIARRAGLDHPRRRHLDHGHRRLGTPEAPCAGPRPSDIATTWLITIPGAALGRHPVPMPWSIFSHRSTP